MLPLLESLCEDETFFSVQDLETKIDELTVRMESIDVIQDRIPLVHKVKRLTALVELNGVDTAEDTKPPGIKEALVKGSQSCVSIVGVFHEKLVDPENIDLQLHEMSFLVSDLIELKVFYTYLNHLRRSKKLATEDWQRYSVNALHQTSRKISLSDSASIEILEGIVSQFRKDGIFVHENIMRSIGINSTYSDVVTELELFEFRVGQILPLVTPQTAKSATGYPILMHVQALGRSLKEFFLASEARDDNHVAAAAICSILNALSFGGPGTLHSCVKPSSVNSVLDQIVDYGDADHICSVLDQSGNEALQYVCKEGLDIIEKARSNETNEDKSDEENNGGTQFLVSVMGHLANGVTKLVRETTRLGKDGDAENHEAVTILALIVTAKMIQMAEPAVEHSWKSQRQKAQTNPKLMRKKYLRPVFSPHLSLPLPVVHHRGSSATFFCCVSRTWNDSCATACGYRRVHCVLGRGKHQRKYFKQRNVCPGSGGRGALQVAGTECSEIG